MDARLVLRRARIANGRSRPEDIIGDHYYRLIFDHGFARALWGEDTVQYGLEVKHGEYERLIHKLPAWKYHLQHIVIADDPITYLGEHL